ncbi:hypothetical protein D3C84_1173350 [compost metagenome]
MAIPSGGPSSIYSGSTNAQLQMEMPIPAQNSMVSQAGLLNSGFSSAEPSLIRPSGP